jgi:hypothetical protein
VFLSRVSLGQSYKPVLQTSTTCIAELATLHRKLGLKVAVGAIHREAGTSQVSYFASSIVHGEEDISPAVVHYIPLPRLSV